MRFNAEVREQSQSIVRGEHPIAFMLPTVSLSDVGSETEVICFFLTLEAKLKISLTDPL